MKRANIKLLALILSLIILPPLMWELKSQVGVVPGTGGIPNDAVQGASSLLTAGANVIVSGANTVTQDTSFSRSALGRYTLYDATATTGVTTLTVRAGAGQSSTNLQEWKNVSAVTLASISALGAFNGAQVIVSNKHNINTASLALASDVPLTFQNGTSIFTGTPDLGLARSSANNLGITNGSSTTYAEIGSNGIILNNGRFQFPTSTPASAAAACTAGTIAWDADYIYVCIATDTWKRSAISTWP